MHKRYVMMLQANWTMLKENRSLSKISKRLKKLNNTFKPLTKVLKISTNLNIWFLHLLSGVHLLNTWLNQKETTFLKTLCIWIARLSLPLQLHSSQIKNYLNMD